MTPKEKYFKIKQLEKIIYLTEGTCGSCSFWMTKKCKRENEHKVSSGEFKCADFEMQIIDKKLIHKYHTELKHLKQALYEGD